MEMTKLAFISVSRFDNNAVTRGAILVTDMETKPLEFRVTGPVRPTPLQKTLYGDVLEEYILVNLLALPLLSAIRERPDLILVRDPVLLYLQPHVEQHVTRISKENDLRYGGDDEPQDVISSLSGRYDPIVLDMHRDFKSALPEIRKSLSTIFAQRDLLEPFERIQVATEQVHNQRLGDRDNPGA